MNTELRAAFHKKLREIQDDVLVMGSMAEKAIIASVRALKERDLKAAEQIISDDTRINKKRFEIENKCVQLIVTQQPMASDMRVIMAVANVITELDGEPALDVLLRDTGISLDRPQEAMAALRAHVSDAQ